MPLGVGAIINLALVAASSVYQINKQKKLKRKQQEEAEKRKGFELTRIDATDNLPVLYGRNVIGGLVTDYYVGPHYLHASPISGYDPLNYQFPNNDETFYFDANHVIQLTCDQYDNPTWINVIVKFWNGATVYNKTITNTAIQGGVLAPTFDDVCSSFHWATDGSWIFKRGPQEQNPSTTVRQFSVKAVRGDGVMRVLPQAWAMSGDHNNTTNEFMFTQVAIAHGGVNQVVDFEIDGNSWREPQYDHGYRVNMYYDGGIYDNMAYMNGQKSTNTFSHTFYASAAWRLNRDDPQFNDVPSQRYYVEGQQVRWIDFTAPSTYTISAVKGFTTNPAYILLDYLTSTIYGRGLDLSKIDLESFYKAAQDCDQIVQTNVTQSGKVNGGISLTNLPKFECNLIIDTAKPVRENVDLILSTMGQANLVWSGGVYKLSLPSTDVQPSVANGLVHSDHVFDDSKIIQDTISINWPNAEDKYNQVTVRFANAYKDFKDDTITWPKRNSAVHLQYLAEDNNERLVTEVNGEGVVNPYHAEALAEQMVRMSRVTHSLKVTLTKEALTLEPGDFFILDSNIAQISNQVYRVEAVSMSDNLTVAVQAFNYDHTTMAWNTKNHVAYGSALTQPRVVAPPTNVLFDSTATSNTLGTSSGQITWTAPMDAAVNRYIVEYSNDSQTTWQSLGETSATVFDVPGLNSGTYNFRVRSKSVLGRLSTPVLALDPSTFVDNWDLQRTTVDQIAVIYADSADEATNNQSYTLGSNTYVAYYVYTEGSPPTLPIRSNIQFTSFVGPAGTPGQDGADGVDGATGPRGPGWWRATIATDPALLSQAQLDATFIAHTGFPAPIQDDRFQIASTGGFQSKAWVYDGSNWIDQAAFIDGNFLVNGTIAADAIDAASMKVKGVATFGGTLKSSNWNGDPDDIANSPGNQGWAIGDTGASFPNLVVRDWIQSGAVSDSVYVSDWSTTTGDNGDVVFGPVYFNCPLTIEDLWWITVKGSYRTRAVYSRSVFTGVDSGTGNNLYRWEHLRRRTALRVDINFLYTNDVWSGWSTTHQAPYTDQNSDGWHSLYFQTNIQDDIKGFQLMIVSSTIDTIFAQTGNSQPSPTPSPNYNIWYNNIGGRAIIGKSLKR